MALFGVCLFQCRYTLTQARALRWSMGLMGTRGLPPLHRGVVAASTFTHVARSVQAFPRASLDSLPRPASCGALLTCASCRRRDCPCGIGARRQRTGGPRGVVGEPESLNKARGRFNNPRVRSPPASFATAHQQSVGTQAMRALGPGREGLTALAPAPTQPHSYSDLKSSKRTR